MLNIFKRATSELPQTLEQLAYKYIDTKLRHSTSRSVRGYGYTVTRYATHLGREPVLADLCEPSISTFLKARLATGLKETSVATEQNRLYAMWRFAFDNRYVDEAPGKKPIPYRDTRKRVTPPQPLDFGPNYEALDFL